MSFCYDNGSTEGFFFNTPNYPPCRKKEKLNY